MRVRHLIGGIPRYLRLLVGLIADPRVARADKALLAGAVVYTLTPFDLVSDFLAIVGRLDDLFLLALTMDRLVARAGYEVVRAHWDGPEEMLLSLRESVGELASRVAGAGASPAGSQGRGPLTVS